MAKGLSAALGGPWNKILELLSGPSDGDLSELGTYDVSDPVPGIFPTVIVLLLVKDTVKQASSFPFYG